MNFDFSATPNNYQSISYKINWALDVYVKPQSNVENFNHAKEAIQVINKIKKQLKNEN